MKYQAKTVQFVRPSDTDGRKGRNSSVAEQQFCKLLVVGSIPTFGSISQGPLARVGLFNCEFSLRYFTWKPCALARRAMSRKQPDESVPSIDSFTEIKQLSKRKHSVVVGPAIGPRAKVLPDVFRGLVAGGTERDEGSFGVFPRPEVSVIKPMVDIQIGATAAFLAGVVVPPKDGSRSFLPSPIIKVGEVISVFHIFVSPIVSKAQQA
jgi:hypothetical protein